MTTAPITVVLDLISAPVMPLKVKVPLMTTGAAVVFGAFAAVVVTPAFVVGATVVLAAAAVVFAAAAAAVPKRSAAIRKRNIATWKQADRPLPRS